MWAGDAKGARTHRDGFAAAVRAKNEDVETPSFFFVDLSYLLKLLSNSRHSGGTFAKRKIDMSIDRPAVAQSLAKAIAYKQCGKDREALE